MWNNIDFFLSIIIPPMNASPAPFVSTISLVGILGTEYCVITPSTNTN